MHEGQWPPEVREKAPRPFKKSKFHEFTLEWLKYSLYLQRVRFTFFSLAAMAPEIMDSSPPGNGKIAVKVMAETVSSIDSTEFKSLRADLAPLFNQNTLAKILSVAEAYLRNNVGIDAEGRISLQANLMLRTLRHIFRKQSLKLALIEGYTNAEVLHSGRVGSSQEAYTVFSRDYESILQQAFQVIFRLCSIKASQTISPIYAANGLHRCMPCPVARILMTSVSSFSRPFKETGSFLVVKRV